MKTLILYATKHGAAREAAERIAKLMEGSRIHDLKQKDIPPLEGFDCVIIGSSLYAGMIRKEAKSFISQNAGSLQGKRLGLFLCGIEGSGEKKYFDDNFPPDILKAAKAKNFLGGIFDPKKAGMMDRLIIKAAAKITEYTDNIDDVKIKQFVEAMKS